MHLLRRICQSDEFILHSIFLYSSAPHCTDRYFRRDYISMPLICSRNGTRTRTGSVVSIQSESIVTLTGIGPWSVDTHLLAVIGRIGTALIIVYKRST